MKLYSIRVEVTQWADVHVVAESQDAADALALDNAAVWLAELNGDSEATVASSETVDEAWEPNELPYLTPAAEELEGELSDGEMTCDEWHDALRKRLPAGGVP